jgi:hypothetical protein
MCQGCPKSPGWVATGWICTIYAEPHKTYYARNNTHCPFNPPKVESKKGKKINPLKAAKRARRGK